MRRRTNLYIESGLWAALVLVCGWLWFWPQPPGIAAVMLGGWAALITFLEMRPVRKGLAIILVVLLVVLELRGIYSDRAAQDAQHQKEQKEMQDDFTKVLKENQESFGKTEAHFESVLEQLKDVAKDITEPTTESRIRINLSDYHEAASEYSHYSWRAQNAKAVMDRAIRNLEALGATAELEKLNAR